MVLTPPMRSLPFCLAAFFGLSAADPASAGESASDTKSVTVIATFASRTSLRVSTDLLQFEVGNAGGEAVASVEFAAGARTRGGDEVLLIVEPLRAIEGAGGAADAAVSLGFSGEGPGMLSGRLAGNSPTVMGRWQGSGLRTGRLMFSLRASVPGRYTIPVRFVLTAP